MSKNPHSEFLKYHGFETHDTQDMHHSDIDMLKADVAEIKFTLNQVLQELRKLNT